MNRFRNALLTLAILAAPIAAQTALHEGNHLQPAQSSAPPAPAATQTAQGAATADKSATGAQATNDSASLERVAAECGCETKPLPDVLATVNGSRITKADLSPEVRERVAQLQRQVIEARRHELDLQINSALLDAEAKRRGTTPRQLLQAEVVAKTAEPTDADAQKFYDDNKARIAGEFAALKDEIKNYLREQRQRELAKGLSERLRAATPVKVAVSEATPPATASDRERLLATVGAARITSADVEESLLPLVFEVQQQVYELRRQDVELKINDALLRQEAERRQITPRSLLAAEVEAKVAPVADADARKFYDENRERVSGEFAQIKDQIVNYLKEQEARKLTAEYAARLRQAAKVETFLAAPSSPVLKIATDDQPSRGASDAAVTLVEFTDFQCPNCAQAQPVLDRLLAEYGGRLRLVVRDFPLSQHADALKAAEAAEAARAQGKYWEYAALLFAHQSALGVDQLKAYATQLGLDRAKFDAALDAGGPADEVQRDVFEGERAGVNGTPAIFVNGRRVFDHSYEGLKAAIDVTLKTPAGR